MAEIVVSVADLQRVCDAVLGHLQEVGYDVVHIPHDYYWEVLITEASDMNSKPTELAVGSIEDDIEQLRRSIDSSRVLVTDLVPLASVLRAVASLALESGPRTGGHEE